MKRKKRRIAVLAVCCVLAAVLCAAAALFGRLGLTLVSIDCDETNGIYVIDYKEDLMKPEPRPGFYALYAWNELKKPGVQVAAESDCPDLYATAARDGNGALRLKGSSSALLRFDPMTD